MDRGTMMQFYKSKRVAFGGITATDKKRKDNEKLRLDRKERRTQMFNVRRSISPDEGGNINVSDNVPKENHFNSRDNKIKSLLDRKNALQKYKQEKEVLKQSLKQKKKPPFVVGIPHHGNSPVLKEISNKIARNCPKQATKMHAGNQRLTRATSKLVQGGDMSVPKSPIRMFPFNDRKSVFSFQLNRGVGLKKLTSPHTPTVLKRSAQKCVLVNKEKVTSNVKRGQVNPKPVAKVLKNVLQLNKKKSSTSSTDSGQSLAAPLPNPDPLCHIVEHELKEATPGTQLDCNPASPPAIGETAHSDLKSEELSDSNQLETNNLEESASQQKQESPKVNTRKSIKKEESEMDNEATFQRERVDSESCRLLALAEEWETTSVKEELPQDVTDEIDSVVGQTRLLTRDKFNQFRRLVDEYLTQQGSKKITVDDLNGFWDMVYIQVESMNKKFSHLEVLKLNNWEEPKMDILRKKRKRSPPQRKPKKPFSPLRANDTDLDLPSSSLRSNVTRRTMRIQKNIAFHRDLEKNSIEDHLTTGTDTLGNLPSIAQNIQPTMRMNLANQVNAPTLASAALEEAAISVACPPTPRRSLRLAAITPTPSKSKCFTCKSPDCDSSSCEQRKGNSSSRRSSKRKITPSISKKLENSSKESTPFGNIQPEGSNEANRTSKRFMLRPSKLIVNDSTNKSPILELARKPLGLKQENSQPNNSIVDSCLVRRSTRIHSAKKVTFDSSFGEKSMLKLPATPYRPSRKGSIQDSFSE